MLGDERPQTRKAEHLAHGVMSLYQPVTVEQCCFASLQDYLLLLVVHRWHKAQGHTPSPKFLSVATATAHIGQVVACVGVAQAAALWVQDAIEAGDNQVGRHVGD